MDFEDQWKEEFLRSYLDAVKKGEEPQKWPKEIWELIKKRFL
jgi:hypothetical protein